MKGIEDKLADIWGKLPGQAMLTDGLTSLTYTAFIKEVNMLSMALAQHKVSSVALLADNSLSWVIADFACQCSGIALLPLPTFFSAQQVQHSIKTAGCELLLTDNPALTAGKISLTTPVKTATTAGQALYLNATPSLYTSLLTPLSFYRIINEEASLAVGLPDNTSKVTFTSGSTGAPKGVCLSVKQQWQVAASLTARVAPMLTHSIKRHLCLLPLSTLLENVAGIYAAMLAGATIVVPSLAELGFSGSSSLNFQFLLKQIAIHQPSSLITTPEILKGLVLATQQGWQPPINLVFVAVGGARVSPKLIKLANSSGIPAFEGYGLSECASVVSLNNCEENQAGSAGKPLPHLDVTIADGEIFVSGNTFLGYAGDPASWGQEAYATGDLGYFDQQGFLQISGRKKNMLISSYGRNINPEWLESELNANAGIKQAIVFGDSQPHCIAGILPRVIGENQLINSAQIDLFLATMNKDLPDYAQVKGWFYLPETLFTDPRLNTANGRIKRQPMTDFLQAEIDEFYQIAI